MFGYCNWFCTLFFFFNDTATTEIYTLSLHDALPILLGRLWDRDRDAARDAATSIGYVIRSEEHTSELQSPCNLVCRLLLEKKNNNHLAPSQLHTQILLLLGRTKYETTPTISTRNTNM